MINYILNCCGCSCSNRPDARLQPTPVSTQANQPSNAVNGVALSSLAATASQEVIVGLPRGQQPTVAAGSIYSGDSDGISIDVSHIDLIRNPQAHLMEFAELITKQSGEMVVEFQGEECTDTGGISRQYLTTLFEGLVRDFGGANYNHLFLPRTSANYVNESGKLPTVTENDIYYNLGKVLMYCYSHNLSANKAEHYLIGMRFPQELFTAIFSLPPSEVTSGKVSDNTLFAILELLITNNKDTEGKNNALQMLQILRQTGPITDAQKAHYAFVGPDIKAGLRNQLLKDYGHFIAPMVAIARGMKDVTKEPAAITTAEEFMRSIQGSQDPQVIKSAIQCGWGSVQTKADWIREWIVETTPANRERFLKFVTGASVLQSGGIITIAGGRRGRLPVAHTCSLELQVSPSTTHEETKEKFIARLITAMNEGLAGNFTIV